MTSLRDLDASTTNDLTAHELLAPTLIGLIDAAQAAAARVERSFRATRRRAASEAAEIDPQAVHDFRVALRRLRTLLRVGRRIYGKKHTRPFEDGLRRGARATSALRDEEVLRETLASLELSKPVRRAVEAWQLRRARQERAQRSRVVAHLSGNAGRAMAQGAGRAMGKGHDEQVLSLRECLSQLRERLEQGRAREQLAAATGRRAVGRALDRALKLSAESPDDAQAMHALRIRFKRLRYAAELFVPVLGDQTAQLVRQAARMQKRLGELHDLDEAIVRMRRAWGLGARPRAAVLRALQSARRTMARRTQKDIEAFLGPPALP